LLALILCSPTYAYDGLSQGRVIGIRVQSYRVLVQQLKAACRAVLRLASKVTLWLRRYSASRPSGDNRYFAVSMNSISRLSNSLAVPLSNGSPCLPPS
jgi:hypothetical protein